MNKGLVSVVVPVYNTEKFLDRCINSIVNQTYRRIELLLIDDGSPDRCPQICDEWAEKDSRIRVFHKVNEGQGIARNVGIENAKGEFICFIDSDDYIEPRTIELAYEKACAEQAQIVVFGMKTVDSSGQTISTFVPDDRISTFRGQQVLDAFFPEFLAPDPFGDGKKRFYMSACLLLYSMDVIRGCGWRFVSEREIISEDVYSLTALFKYIESVAILPEALYHCCVNEQSFSRKYWPGKYHKIRHCYQETIALCRCLGYSEDILHRVSKPYLANVLGTLKQEIEAPLSLRDRKKNIRDIIDDDVLQQVLAANKRDKVSVTRRIMFFAMRNRAYSLCYCLLWAKR